MNIVDKIIDYESGIMTDDDIVDLFANLIKTGLAWNLQGSYGRAAKALIDNGVISEEGEIYDR
jgi:hypothetical protein